MTHDVPDSPNEPASPDAAPEVQRVVVSRTGRGAVPRDPAAAPAAGGGPGSFVDLSAPLGGVLGSGKRVFVRTFKWVGLLAVVVTVAAAAWAGGGGRTGRGVLTAFLVFGPTVVIAVVLAGRRAAWALAAEARRQLGAAGPVENDQAARAQTRSAVGGAVLAMVGLAAFVAWAVRTVWR